MMDGETLTAIRKEIQKQLNVILSGQAGENTQFVEDIVALYPGMPAIVSRPVMHPYGFASRAPTGTLQVTARQGEHAGNRMVLGHRDANRPTLNNQGECLLYDADGNVIYLGQNGIGLGGPNVSSPAVLGDVLVNALNALISQINTLLTDIQAITVVCAAPGSPSSVPVNAAAFVAIATQLNSLVNQYLTTASSNILSQQTFLQRQGPG